MLQSRQFRSIADPRQALSRALVPLKIGRACGLIVALAVVVAAGGAP